jgi:hypothetical protein
MPVARWLLEQEDEFVSTVAETFNIAKRSSSAARPSWKPNGAPRTTMPRQMLYIDGAPAAWPTSAKHLHAHGLQGEVRVLHVPRCLGLYVMRYLGSGPYAAQRSADGTRDQAYVLGQRQFDCARPRPAHLLQ